MSSGSPRVPRHASTLVSTEVSGTGPFRIRQRFFRAGDAVRVTGTAGVASAQGAGLTGGAGARAARVVDRGTCTAVAAARLARARRVRIAGGRLCSDNG